jgi:hypothetical protein
VTTLGAWVSYPTVGGKSSPYPGALYLVSDSRITWGRQRRWDAGKKLFSAKDEPHIFGYCGDVVFPSLVLAQIVSAIDQNILFPADADMTTRHGIIFNSIKTSFSRRHNAPDEDFWILHGARKTPWRKPSFALWVIEYRAKDKVWSSTEIQIAAETRALISLGTGQSSAKVQVRRWADSDVGGTSRSIFSAFHAAIKSGVDPQSGGAPQIAALYSTQGPQTIGFIHAGVHYLHGLEFVPGPELSNIEWCDELFQRMNPTTLKRLTGSRRFARPRGV